MQQKLLRAARFGMDFLEGTPDSFIQVTKRGKALGGEY
jgi:hypothetical protein